MIIVGLVAGLVAGSWGIVPLSFIVVGIALVAGWLLYHSNSLPQFLGRRSTKAGTNAIVATLAVLTILGLVNFLGVRYDNRFDLTENKLYTISPQTIEVVQGLTEPIKVWIFDIEPNAQDLALLDSYQKQSDDFSYEYVDPQAKPNIAREFGVQALGEVYLEQGGQRKLLQTIAPENRLSESRLTNALAQASAAEPNVAYFLQGHGERALEPGTGGEGSLTQAIAQLQEENINAQPLNLAERGQIPDDADVVVVAGPQRPLLEVEVQALQDYLKKDKGLLLLLDPQTQPGLSGLLEGWGVGLSDRLIVEPTLQNIGNPAAFTTVVTEYGNHPITENLGDGISFYYLAQPLLTQELDTVELTPLLITSDRVQGQQVLPDGQLQFNPDTDPQGPFVIGVALTRPAETVTSAPSPDAASPTPDTASPTPSPSPSDEASDDEADTAADEDASGETRLVVIGNSSFASDGSFEQQLNSDVFLNTMSWLSQEDNPTLSIRPKQVDNRRITLNGQQQILLALMALLFVPLVGFGMAIGTWWTRR